MPEVAKKPTRTNAERQKAYRLRHLEERRKKDREAKRKLRAKAKAEAAKARKPANRRRDSCISLGGQGSFV